MGIDCACVKRESEGKGSAMLTKEVLCIMHKGINKFLGASNYLIKNL